MSAVPPFLSRLPRLEKAQHRFQLPGRLRAHRVHPGFPPARSPTRGTRVSDGFFRTLGVAPILGRDFYAGEDLPAAPRTVLLSYAAWRQRYGGKPDVLGKTVHRKWPDRRTSSSAFCRRIFIRSRRALGVLDDDSRRQRMRSEAEAFHSLLGVARLKDGMTVSTALANVTAIAKRRWKEVPGSNRDQGAAIAPLGEVIVEHPSHTSGPAERSRAAAADLPPTASTWPVCSSFAPRAAGAKSPSAPRSALRAPHRLNLSPKARFLPPPAAPLASYLDRVGHATPRQTHSRGYARPPLPFLLGLGLNVRVLAFAGFIALLAAVLFSLTPAVHFSVSEAPAEPRPKAAEAPAEIPGAASVPNSSCWNSRPP